LRGFLPRVKVPGLLLRSLACRSSYSFGFSTPPPVAGLPQHPAASTPQARCILHRPAPPAVPLVFAPLQEFLLPWDQRAGKLRNRSVHLPNSPDLRSLPAAFPLKDSATDHRSRSATFPEACCFQGTAEVHQTPRNPRYYAGHPTLSPGDPIPGSLCCVSTHMVMARQRPASPEP